MGFFESISQKENILMEGALGERLKREYQIQFHESVAMATLIYSEEGRKALRHIWGQYMEIARRHDMVFLAATPTRRANIQQVMTSSVKNSIVRDNVEFLREIQRSSGMEMYVGGLLGCKGDAYTGNGALSIETAKMFHTWQAEQFRQAGADYLLAGIMPTLPEATGMALAMSNTGLPYVISFTIQKQGTLIDGTTIHDAIRFIDERVKHKPAFYMTNCVHPAILAEALDRPFNQTETVRNRFWGIQANTANLPYDQLEGSEELMGTEPKLLAEEMIKLKENYGLKVFGGCCGTDWRHMEFIAERLSNRCSQDG